MSGSSSFRLRTDFGTGTNAVPKPRSQQSYYKYSCRPQKTDCQHLARDMQRERLAVAALRTVSELQISEHKSIAPGRKAVRRTSRTYLMIDRGERIRALSTKRKFVEKLTVDAVLEAMQPQEKPVLLPKADLRRQAEAAVASFTGAIIKPPAIDPATIVKPKWRDRT